MKNSISIELLFWKKRLAHCATKIVPKNQCFLFRKLITTALFCFFHVFAHTELKTQMDIPLILAKKHFSSALIGAFRPKILAR
jgi:hypothetical protein